MGSRRHPSCVDKLGCSIPVSFLLLHYVWLRLGKWIHVHSALKFSQRELFREIDWRPYFWHHQDTNMEIQWGWKYLVIGKVMAVHPTRNMFETKNMCPKTHLTILCDLFSWPFWAVLLARQKQHQICTYKALSCSSELSPKTRPQWPVSISAFQTAAAHRLQSCRQSNQSIGAESRLATFSFLSGCCSKCLGHANGWLPINTLSSKTKLN